MTLLVKALLVDSNPDAAFAQAVTGGSEARRPPRPEPDEAEAVPADAGSSDDSAH
jgi:hypothetical protein